MPARSGRLLIGHLRGRTPADKTAQVTGIYKDDDDKYSLENLLKAQEGGDLQ